MPFRTRHALLSFIALAFLLRWGSFFISVINHDESTYIVIADELLRGEVYLRDAIDTKPIGIFWLYAALIKLTGGSIVALRAAAALVVALGAWGLSLATWRASKNRLAAYAAGTIYCFACSLYTYYGVSPNTEIFFNAFTISAVALAVAPRIRSDAGDPFWHWPVAGLLLGLAFIIKPFAAAESLAVGLFLVWFYGRRRMYVRLFSGGLALVGAFSLPLLFVVAYYASLGLLQELWFYSFEVSAAYPVELPWYLRLKYMGDYLLRYAPFVILAGAAFYRTLRGAGPRVQGKRGWQTYLLLQFLLVTIVVLLTGKRFGHYQVQLHPVLALLAATWWFGRTHVRRWLLPAVIVAAMGIGIGQFVKYRNKPDEPRDIATYFQDKLQPGEQVFGINGFQIVHHLLDRPVPTPYIHSSLLFLDHHLRAFRIDEDQEAQRLVDNPELRYVFGRKDDPEANSELTRSLLQDFEATDTLASDIVIWRRR